MSVHWWGCDHYAASEHFHVFILLMLKFLFFAGILQALGVAEEEQTQISFEGISKWVQSYFDGSRDAVSILSLFLTFVSLCSSWERERSLCT